MRAVTAIAVVLATVLLASGCGGDGSSSSAKQTATELSADQPLSPSPLPEESGQTESPAETRQDVAMAEQQAQDTREQIDMATAVAKAEAEYKVQVEKCEGLQGPERTACITAADRVLAEVKARETAKLEIKQPQT